MATQDQLTKKPIDTTKGRKKAPDVKAPGGPAAAYAKRMAAAKLAAKLAKRKRSAAAVKHTLASDAARQLTNLEDAVSKTKTSSLVMGAIPSEIFYNRQVFIDATRKGIPGKWVKEVIRATGLRETFLDILNVSSGNLSRVYQKKALEKDSSEEVLDAVRVISKAQEVWESNEIALQWLNAPVAALGGKQPVELFDTFEGRRWVSQVLSKIEHGDFS
jgi:putative toxin-antitoxin system antitoxin component (TIGR02293 family)